MKAYLTTIPKALCRKKKHILKIIAQYSDLNKTFIFLSPFGNVYKLLDITTFCHSVWLFQTNYRNPEATIYVLMFVFVSAE